MADFTDFINEFTKYITYSMVPISQGFRNRFES